MSAPNEAGADVARPRALALYPHAFSAFLRLVETDEEDLADTATGEVIPLDQARAAWDLIELELGQKITATVPWLRGQELDVEDLKARIAELTTAKKATESRVAFVRTLVTAAMKAREIASGGERSLKTPLGTVSLAKDRERAPDIENESAIPAEFFDAEVKLTLNRERLEAALKAGVDVPGARLPVLGDHLRITKPRAPKAKKDALEIEASA